MARSIVPLLLPGLLVLFVAFLGSLSLPCRVGAALRLLAAVVAVGILVRLATDGEASIQAMFWAVTLVVFAFFWLVFGRPAIRQLDRSIDQHGWSPGWSLPRDVRQIAAERWYWFESLHGRRCLKIDRLALDGSAASLRAVFTLVRPWFFPTMRTRRWLPPFLIGSLAGGGVIARTARDFHPPIIAVPQSFFLKSLYKRLAGIRLPEVHIDEPELAQRWAVYSENPEEASAAISRDPEVRSALRVASEGELGRVIPRPGEGIRFGPRPKYLTLIVEFRGDQVALLGGPKFLGRNTIEDLVGSVHAVSGEVR